MGVLITSVGIALAVAALAVSALWVWGLVASAARPEPISIAVPRPIIDVIRCTTVVGPGSVATIHLRVRGAIRCWISWTGIATRADRLAVAPQLVDDNGEVMWSCTIADSATESTWPVTVTAEGNAGRTSAKFPMRVVAKSSEFAGRQYVAPAPSDVSPYDDGPQRVERPSPTTAPRRAVSRDVSDVLDVMVYKARRVRR